MTYDVLILADGLFPEKKEIRSLISYAPAVVCCDGAAQKLMDFGRMPDFVVGDLDSLPSSVHHQLGEKLIHIPDQESNDLTKAVQLCLSKGWSRILVTGATGLREDHTLANIALMHKYLDWKVEVSIISDFGKFTPIVKTTSFISYRGEQISIFSLTPQTHISVEGLRYPIENRTLDSWWMGTLNESLGNSFTIQLHADGKLIVYQVFV